MQMTAARLILNNTVTRYIYRCHLASMILIMAERYGHDFDDNERMERIVERK
jgi:hypothetical protein